MTTVVEPEIWPPQVVIYDATWDLYEKLLKAIGNQHVRVTFDQGVMEIMSPLPEHERIKGLIGRLAELLALELDIPLCSLGSTTFKRKDLEKGLEPDECYYTRNERAIRGKKRLDLKRDPPPDLVIEVDLSRRSVKKQVIYAALGVPEIWSYETEQSKLRFLQLRRGKYHEIQISISFPMLRPTDLEQFIAMAWEVDDTSIMRSWRDWIRKRIARRSNGRS
jgi:Uma2 family endonuclease